MKLKARLNRLEEALVPDGTTWIDEYYARLALARLAFQQFAREALQAHPEQFARIMDRMLGYSVPEDLLEGYRTSFESDLISYTPDKQAADETTLAEWRKKYGRDPDPYGRLEREQGTHSRQETVFKRAMQIATERGS